jgi:hypothetical protein
MRVETRRRIWRYVILTAGVIALCVGIYEKEVGTVLNKAINICLECIGIG